MLSVLVASDALTLPTCRVRDNVFSASACSALHDVASALGRSKHLLHRGSPRSVLEQALEEVHKPKAQNAGAGQRSKAKEEERLKELKELEVQDYLKQIKKREQDMLLQAREGVEALKEKKAAA